MNTSPISTPSSADLPNIRIIDVLDASQVASHLAHTHDEIEIICVLTGEASVLIGSHLEHSRAGDIHLIGSNLPHSIQFSESDETRIMVVHLNDKFMADLIVILKDFQPLGHFFGHDIRGIIWRDQLDELIPSILKLKNVQGMQTIIDLVKVFSALSTKKQHQTIHQLRTNPVAASGRVDDKISRIFEFTEEHYREAITLQQIAGVVNFTVTSFCRYFKKCTGKNYYQYLNDLRIDKACQLLIECSSKSVEEVCYMTGYSSPSTFYKHFRKTLNMTPKEYQEKAGRQLNSRSAA